MCLLGEPVSDREAHPRDSPLASIYLSQDPIALKPPGLPSSSFPYHRQRPAAPSLHLYYYCYTVAFPCSTLLYSTLPYPLLYTFSIPSKCVGDFRHARTL